MPERDLTQLQKISDLRKRRSERALKAAKIALAEAKAALNLAEQSLQTEQSQVQAAKHDSYTNPESEQAWIWQSVAEGKQQDAATHRDNMCGAERDCASGLKQAGRALLKAQVKVDGFEAIRRKQQKAEERKAEDALAEERQDALRNRPRIS